jgi:hypothetical protein
VYHSSCLLTHDGLLLQPLHSSQPCVMIHIRNSPCHPWQCRCCVTQDTSHVTCRCPRLIRLTVLPVSVHATCRRCLRLSHLTRGSYSRRLTGCSSNYYTHHRLLLQPLHSSQPCVIDPQRMLTDLHTLPLSHSSHMRLAAASPAAPTDLHTLPAS